MLAHLLAFSGQPDLGSSEVGEVPHFLVTSNAKIGPLGHYARAGSATLRLLPRATIESADARVAALARLRAGEAERGDCTERTQAHRLAQQMASAPDGARRIAERLCTLAAPTAR